MATVTKPIALDESINTTELTPRNIADVLAEELKGIADNILPPNASQIAYDNTASGLSATNVQDAIDEVISSQADVIADTMADLTENKTATVTDGVADFETIDGSLVKSLVVEIEPSQSGSGTPSPDNIRPITGWTQEDVFVVSKNYADIIQGGCATDGTITADSTRLCNSDYIPVEEGQSFTISMVSLTNKIVQGYFRTFTAKGTENARHSIGWTTSSLTVDIENGEHYLQFIIRNSDNSNITPSDVKVVVYSNGKTYTTPFNQTVYGGTLDVLSGELTIDRQFQSFDGSENWQANTTGTTFFYVTVASLPTGSEVVCNEFENKPITTINDDIGVSANANVFRCRPSTSIASDVATFKTWLSTHPIEIVRYITTPTTLSLTPQTVKALVGENHISASTGDVLECKFSMLINGDDLEMLLS